MEHSTLPFVLRRWRKATFAGVMVASLSFVAVFVFGPDYSVRTDYLVSQDGAMTKDYYSLTRSAEYMSRILTEVTGSERFIDAVIETGKVGQDFLPSDKRERLASWRRMVRLDKKLDLGIIGVTVSADDMKSAQKVSLAISQVFTERNGRFLGGGDANVPVTILSGPITERNPSAIRIAIAVLGGFAVGFFGYLLRSFVASMFRETKDHVS
ncbi:MAG: hypothetical protein HGA38_01765 [Candidatus Moranbacteria bacterium]|nr:hypothetical protein [Candidatus Moranbacteria bacterium]